jgi:hypothetical protein
VGRTQNFVTLNLVVSEVATGLQNINHVLHFLHQWLFQYEHILHHPNTYHIILIFEFVIRYSISLFHLFPISFMHATCLSHFTLLVFIALITYSSV